MNKPDYIDTFIAEEEFNKFYSIDEQEALGIRLKICKDEC